MVKNVFYGNLNALTSGFRDILMHERVILAMIVVLIFIVGVYPEPMFNMIRSASEVIIGKYIK
jgi:NADH-quinone oxidoreductase subunit M